MPDRIHTRLLRGIAHIACGRYRLVLAIAFLLTLASLIPPLTIGMRFAFDISKMLPQKVRAARAFTRAVVDFDSVDDAVVVFRLMDGMQQVPLAGRVADNIAARLREDSRIKDAFCRKYNQDEIDFLFRTELPKRGLLLLSPDSLRKVKENLEPRRMSSSVKRTVRRLFDAPDDERAREQIAFDAIRFASVFQNALSGLNASVPGQDDKGYIVAEIDESKRDCVIDDAKALLLLVIQPSQPAQSAKFSNDIMALIRTVTDEEVEKGFPKAARESIMIEFGGGYEIATRYGERVNETLLVTLLTSLFGVILLFGWCFRRPGVLIYIGVPLVMVVCWTIGAGWIIFGQLNIVSCAFAAVLVGLGVDYAIHIYNRYVEERTAGASVEDAFAESLAHTGWAVFIGMATTCMAFLALKATRFTQLSQFGVLAGLGIALSVPGMLFVLPALITWRNNRKAEHPRALRPSSFGLSLVADLIEKHCKLVLAFALLAAVVSGAQFCLKDEALSFDERISSLRPDERAFELGGEIARVFSNRNPNKLMLLAYGETERDALERAATLAKGCKELVKEGRLLDYESVMRFIPSPSEQQDSLKILKEIDFKKALENFRAELDRQGVAEEPFALTINLLKQHADLVETDDPVILPSDFEDSPVGKWTRRLVTRRRRMLDLRDPLPEDMKYPLTLAKPAIDRDGNVRAEAGTQLTRQQLADMGPEGSAPEVVVRGADGAEQKVNFTWVKRITVLDHGWTVKANVYPPIVSDSKTADLKIDEKWLAEVRSRLGLHAEDSDGNGNGAFLTGSNLLAHELAGVVKEDFWNVSLAVFGVAVLVLAIFFHRHPVRVLYCLLPIVLGLLYLFGIMSIGHISFNFINVLAVPILIGLGVDNGIHLVNRFYESGRHVRPMIVDTGRAIMITSLTSMVGFGSLAVGGYQGITSMGVLSILALSSSLFASLIVFPAILTTFSPPEEAPKDPEDDQD